MRTMVLAVVFATALCGCEKPVAIQPTESPRVDPAPVAPVSTPLPSTPAPVPVVKAEPAPPPPEPIVAATPAPREIAPDGVFYVIAPISIETDSGIHSLLPGTGVKRVRDGIYQTPKGELPIDSSKLTNDLAIARAARDAAASTQAALQTRSAAAVAVASDQEKMANLNAAADANVNAADAKYTALSNKASAMRQQRAAMEAQVEVLARKVSREQDGRDMGRSVASNSSAALAAARAQLKLLKDELREVERELRSSGR